MNKKIRIIYNGSANLPREVNHGCRLSECKTVFHRTFKTTEEAVDFWFECTSPVTKLEKIIPWEYLLQGEPLKIEEDIEEFDEEIFWNTDSTDILMSAFH